ncbi:MAG: hypothetical protein H0U57_05730 [Tatlockia sp.]|nr:hypothetical protein [Tatlockia sp.]
MSTVLSTQSALANDESITYKNKRGSVLTLNFSTDNSINGTFTTAVANKECQEAIGMERPVIGYIANNAITFSVNYPKCGSVVTFIGNLQKDKNKIDTTWIVAHQNDSIKSNIGTRLIGHDVFKRKNSF